MFIKRVTCDMHVSSRGVQPLEQGVEGAHGEDEEAYTASYMISDKTDALPFP